jgi:hypothetical protein
MGFVTPLTSSTRAVDTLYLWRSSGSYWSENELATLQEHYPTASRNELLHLFPTRSWVAIIQKAAAKGIRRIAGSDKLDIPREMSLSDVRVQKEFALQPGERVQWQHEYTHYELGKDVIPT